MTAEIPIIMITARDDLDARAEGMRLGVSEFLAKPVFRRQLASRVRAQLEVVETSRNATARDGSPRSGEETIATRRSRIADRLESLSCRSARAAPDRIADPRPLRLQISCLRDRLSAIVVRENEEEFAMDGDSRRPQANMIAALTYLLGFVTGLIFLYLSHTIRTNSCASTRANQLAFRSRGLRSLSSLGYLSRCCPMDWGRC